MTMEAFSHWTCHFCGEDRPDRCISVVRKPILMNGMSIGEHNRRYCNDNHLCIEAAYRWLEEKDAEGAEQKNR